MEKSNLYTRGGDAGTTSLVGGQRVAKASTRLDAYGTIDEFSSFLGCVIASPDCPEPERSRLLKVQNKLFNVGAYLATESTDENPATLYGLTGDDVAEIERWIDEADAATPKMRSFVLPGGTMLAAHTHVARAVCRRAERRIFALCEAAFVDPIVTGYLNRLSDLLFILARRFNHLAGADDVAWQK